MTVRSDTLPRDRRKLKHFPTDHICLSQQSGSRANSLTVNDVEITRQFLATNNKVINRGDSFRRRDRNTDTEERTMKREPSHTSTVHHQEKAFRVVFLGGREVGKSSIIHQFMSSEHTDVFEDNLDNEEDEDEHNKNKER